MIRAIARDTTESLPTGTPRDRATLDVVGRRRGALVRRGLWLAACSAGVPTRRTRPKRHRTSDVHYSHERGDMSNENSLPYRKSPSQKSSATRANSIATVNAVQPTAAAINMRGLPSAVTPPTSRVTVRTIGSLTAALKVSSRVSAGRRRSPCFGQTIVH